MLNFNTFQAKRDEQLQKRRLVPNVEDDDKDNRFQVYHP